MTTIFYDISSQAWSGVLSRIEDLILKNKFARVIELGGGANPSFSLDFVREHGLQYTLLDVSQDELDKAPAGYNKLRADICLDEFAESGAFDFAFSRMLAEHVVDGAKFHANVHKLLRPGGMAFHFFPTLFAPPFVLNYLMPERAAAKILHFLQPGREADGMHAKFPAHYSWCRGPTRGQIARFQRLGYAVEEYAGYFGHEPYYRRLPFLHRAHTAFSEHLSKHPVAGLTSFAQVTLLKPSQR